MVHDRHEHARKLFSLAYEAQMRGELGEALELYTLSIAAHPTAEAYTFRGWTYSFQGNYRRAIEECLRAIELDPDFGNPYNDIGAYLIEQGKIEDAVPWLEKAAQARRYEHPYFCWFNLGRVYERQHQWKKAVELYRRALASNAHYVPARRALARVRAHWN